MGVEEAFVPGRGFKLMDPARTCNNPNGSVSTNNHFDLLGLLGFEEFKQVAVAFSIPGLASLGAR